MAIRKPHRPIVKFVAFENDELACFAVNKIRQIKDRSRKEIIGRVYVETQILPCGKRPEPWNVLIMSASNPKVKMTSTEESEGLHWQDGHLAVASHLIHDEVALPESAKSIPFVVLLRTLPGKEFRTSYPEAILRMYAQYAQGGFEGTPWGAIVKPTKRKALGKWLTLCSETLKSYPNAVKTRLDFGFEHEEYVFYSRFPTVNASEDQDARTPLKRGSLANG